MTPFSCHPIHVPPSKPLQSALSFSLARENEGLRKRARRGSHTNKKRVSFDTEVMLILSTHLIDYTEDEVSKCWYLPQEYRAMKKSLIAQTKILEEGKEFDDIEKSSRGIECYLIDNMTTRIRERQRATDAVLDEQELQDIQRRSYDHERIAKKYRKQTAASTRRALELARQDHQTAR